jgi:DNA-directed RNA polymerase subunit RPC12/RpoP
LIYFQHYTLIYITSPTPFQNETGFGGSLYNNNNNHSSSSSHTEYPLTPPEQSTDSNMYPPMGSYMGSPGMQPTPPQTLSDCEDEDSQMDIAASDLTLSIVDGRTKKSKHGGIQFFGKDPKSKYTCSECGKNYATSSNLSRHKQTHRSLDSGSAKKCNICGKMYVSMPALSMHILTHNLNHRCHVCGKAFSRPWLLQGHLRSHTGQKPYLCTVCKKCFADRSNLRAHMQTHSPAKNFQCSKCKKTFALKSYLNKHYESACVRGLDSPTPNSQESFAMLS